MANKLPPVAEFCKSRLRIATVLWVLSVSLTGCGFGVESVAPTPNPNPKEIYEITVTVENAPGAFVSADGHMLFIISKAFGCLPRSQLSGVPYVDSVHVEKLNVKQISPMTFITKVVLDPYKKNNDYGKDDCEWEIADLLISLHNGINRHDIYVNPRDGLITRYAARLDTFRAAKLAKNTGLASVYGRVVTDENSASFPADTYFYITANARMVTE